MGDSNCLYLYFGVIYFNVSVSLMFMSVFLCDLYYIT